jgi:hypothetical protein
MDRTLRGMAGRQRVFEKAVNAKTFRWRGVVSLKQAAKQRHVVTGK